MKRVLGAVIALTLAALPVSANIWIDEGFEDSTPFTNHNYPIKDDTTPPSQSLIDTYQGFLIRASATDEALTPPSITTTGAATTAAAWKGSQSLQLNSGQSVFITGPYRNSSLNWYNATQFAVAVDTATLSLASGTQVGHYKQNWSLDGNNDTIELAYQVNFVVNSMGSVDVIVQNTASTVGQLYDPGYFKVITVLAQKQWQNVNWECYDPLTSTYKGPQPTGDPANGSGTAPVVPPGLNLFLNSNTPGSTYKPDGFGNWPNNTPADQANSTDLRSWELVAENGGILYVDEYFWGSGIFQDGDYPVQDTRDGAARINEFAAAAPPAPPSNSARDWNMFY